MTSTSSNAHSTRFSASTMQTLRVKGLGTEPRSFMGEESFREMLQTDYSIALPRRMRSGSYNAGPKHLAKLRDSPNAGPPPVTQLNALSPLDGRYAKSVDALRGHFSEAALIR